MLIVASFPCYRAGTRYAMRRRNDGAADHLAASHHDGQDRSVSGIFSMFLVYLLEISFGMRVPAVLSRSFDKPNTERSDRVRVISFKRVKETKDGRVFPFLSFSSKAKTEFVLFSRDRQD